MSVFHMQIKEFKGFLKTFFGLKQSHYWNRHMSPVKTDFSRVYGRHKRSGATYSCSLKQFDCTRMRVYHKFHGKTANPSPHEMMGVNFNFGRKKNENALAFNTKFHYK